MPKGDYAAFRALDPFFAVVMEGLSKFVDGEHYFDTLDDDVWSSLRAPSNVPVMTVLEPSNAVLAALQILSARNPRLYAHVREEIENRTINTIQI